MRRDMLMLTDNQIRKVDALRRKALLAGIAGTAVVVLGGILNGALGGLGLEKIFQAFIVAYLLILGLGVGSLAVVMVHHLCGGTWSYVIQRINEAGSRTLPFLFVAGAIIILGGAAFTHVYPWMDEDFLHKHHIVENKLAFLNLGTFITCFLGYFAVWGVLAYFYNHWSLKLDQSGDQKYIGKMKFWAAPGLILYVLTMTFAATHWAMSLEPEWFSTIYGAWLIGSYALTVIAFSVIVLTYAAEEKPLKDLVTSKQYHHLGNFLLGFTVFWAYTAFSQFLLIWNANMPEEIGYYLHRQGGGLTLMSVVLMAFHWFFPMFILLMRNQKTNLVKLRRVAYYILVMRIVDVYWNIAPSFSDSRAADGVSGYINPVTVVLVLAAVVGLGGLWLYTFLGQLKKRPLAPLNDPRRELMFVHSEAHSHA